MDSHCKFWRSHIYLLYTVFDFSINLRDIDIKSFPLTLLLNFEHIECKKLRSRFINKKVTDHGGDDGDYGDHGEDNDDDGDDNNDIMMTEMMMMGMMIEMIIKMMILFIYVWM